MRPPFWGHRCWWSYIKLSAVNFEPVRVPYFILLVNVQPGSISCPLQSKKPYRGAQKLRVSRGYDHRQVLSMDSF